MDHLIKAAVILRAGQFYCHHAHNNTKGNTFFEDHSFFGEVYPAFEAAYDGCIERYIGLTGKPADTLQLGCDAYDLLSDLPKDGGSDNRAFYQGLLHIEGALCKYVESCVKASLSEGTRQMLGNLADSSEMRQYKIKQRLRG